MLPGENWFLVLEATMKETKQERRGRRRAKEKAKMPQHARSLARVYKDAVSKRAGAVRIHTGAA
jgi:hypothetical protein